MKRISDKNMYFLINDRTHSQLKDMTNEYIPQARIAMINNHTYSYVLYV